MGTALLNFPPFWFNDELVLKEMRGRLERVEEAVQEEGGPVTLQDLAFASCPSFKLLSILHIAAFSDGTHDQPSSDLLTQIQMNHLRSIGSIDFRALILKCDQDGVDVDKIHRLMNEPIRNLLTKLLQGEFKKEGDKKPTLLKTLVREAEVELKETNLKVSIETIRQHEEMVRFVEYLLIHHHFNLFEYDFDFKKAFLGMKKEKELVATEEETKKRDEAAKKMLETSSPTYLILSPVNPQLDPLFTLLYKDNGEINSVVLDFFAEPSEVCLDQHALSSLKLAEFKEYCDSLPVSLRAVKKDTLTGVIETFSVRYEGQRINVLILDGVVT